MDDDQACILVSGCMCSASLADDVPLQLQLKWTEDLLNTLVHCRLHHPNCRSYHAEHRVLDEIASMHACMLPKLSGCITRLTYRI